MKNLPIYLINPVLIAGLMIGGGLASLASIVAMLIYILMAGVSTLAFMGEFEAIRKGFAKRKNMTAGMLFQRVGTVALILAAAYNGNVATAAIVMLMWGWSCLVIATIRDQDKQANAKNPAGGNDQA